ncbi:hypothetical protein [Amycolatopsis tucumanensis]|uniref:hypothetical protein n=1 Tax=Amycolatopsis tucumanensis TaxID=401106 RepID=UPI003D7052C0
MTARWPQPGPLSARGERSVVVWVDVFGGGATGVGEGGGVATRGEVVDGADMDVDGGADVAAGAAGFSPQALAARTTAATNPATRAFTPVNRNHRGRR